MAIGVLSSNSRRLYEEYRKSLPSPGEDGDFQWLLKKGSSSQTQPDAASESSSLKTSPPIYYSRNRAIPTENEIRFDGALGSKNTYFKYADELGVISYRSATFYCDTETDTLKLGDCSNPANCIRITLTDGGYLMVNRDNIDQLLDAITFFSPTDQALILRAVQQERMKEGNLTQMEKEKDKVLELVRDMDEEKKTAEDIE